MLIANGILRTVHKHSSVTTLPAGRGGGAEEEFEIKKFYYQREGGGAEEEFEIYVASCSIIFG